jgi:biopolymer transport protein ExbD
MIGGRTRRRGSSEMTLNITSMMDMFTIILVFLLFSFKSQDESFTLAKDVKLPESSSTLDLQDALNIKMELDQLVVQETAVMRLVQGGLPPDVQLDGHIIVLLKAVIEQVVKTRPPVEKGEESVVIFQADRRVRYADLDKVMKTAAASGFPNFRFAIMKK